MAWLFRAMCTSATPSHTWGQRIGVCTTLKKQGAAGAPSHHRSNRHLSNGHLLPLKRQSDLLQLILGEEEQCGHRNLLPLPGPSPSPQGPPATAARKTLPPGRAAQLPCVPGARCWLTQGTADEAPGHAQGCGQLEALLHGSGAACIHLPRPGLYSLSG